MTEQEFVIGVKVKSEFLRELLKEVKTLRESAQKLERLITFELEKNLELVPNPEE